MTTRRRRERTAGRALVAASITLAVLAEVTVLTTPDVRLALPVLVLAAAAVCWFWGAFAGERQKRAMAEKERAREPGLEGS